MKESKRGRTWHFENGEKFTWISGEHCLVLVGYNEDFYYFNDPQSGSTVAHQKSIAEERFEELGSQAVYIYPKEHFQRKAASSRRHISPILIFFLFKQNLTARLFL